MEKERSRSSAGMTRDFGSLTLNDGLMVNPENCRARGETMRAISFNDVVN